jgi:predicted dehydrogenase
MTRPLRAVVIGTGWAGEGHTLAMRAGGAAVVAVCGRRAEAARELADRLAVPAWSADWRAVLRAERPDVLCIATAAAQRRSDVVAEAATLGCHLFCDKPLALDAAEARRVWERTRAARVRHAYASTYLYDPSAAWITELLAGGSVGVPREIEWSQRSGRGAPAAWSWFCDIGLGGGLLNNGFTHLLGTLQRITGGTVTAAAGDCVTERGRLPVVPGLSDFRRWRSAQVSAAAGAEAEWRATEVEVRYRAFLLLRTAQGELPVTATCATGTPAPYPPNGLRVFGERGTLVAEDVGMGAYRVFRQAPGGASPEPLPVPERLAAAQPAADPVQSRWNALARDFLADVRGEPHAPYLTFEDGWRFQEVIDAIRHGAPWREG